MTDPGLRHHPEQLASDLFAIIDENEDEVDFETDAGNTCNNHLMLCVSPLLDWQQEEEFRRRSGLSHEDFLRELRESITVEEVWGDHFIWLYGNPNLKQLNFLSPYRNKGVGVRSATCEIFRLFNKKMNDKYKLRVGIHYDINYIILIVKDYVRVSQTRVCTDLE